MLKKRLLLHLFPCWLQGQLLTGCVTLGTAFPDPALSTEGGLGTILWKNSGSFEILRTSAHSSLVIGVESKKWGEGTPAPSAGADTLFSAAHPLPHCLGFVESL